MILLPSEFINASANYPIADVRTPAEFQLGHIPNAYNIPIFTNDERAVVGTLYKKQGKEIAVAKGLELVGPKLASFVKEAKKIAVGGKLLVHCWRGGMRSASMAWLFNTAGLKTDTLLGGYKAYRKFNRDILDDNRANIIVLGGYTGSAKTEILKEIANLGHQFVDLEGLAHHKGSAFGHIGELPQPSTEQFENDLGKLWRQLDFNRLVWLEDESKAIGHVFQPEPIYSKIRNSKLLFIQIPLEVRVETLVKVYANIDAEALFLALQKIAKRLGNDLFKKANHALAAGDFHTVARISLRYYDKAYEYGMSLRNQQNVVKLIFGNDSPKQIALKLVEFAEEL